jgi:hypothetical protein
MVLLRPWLCVCCTSLLFHVSKYVLYMQISFARNQFFFGTYSLMHLRLATAAWHSGKIIYVFSQVNYSDFLSYSMIYI